LRCDARRPTVTRLRLGRAWYPDGIGWHDGVTVSGSRAPTMSPLRHADQSTICWPATSLAADIQAQSVPAGHDTSHAPRSDLGNTGTHGGNFTGYDTAPINITAVNDARPPRFTPTTYSANEQPPFGGTLFWPHGTGCQSPAWSREGHGAGTVSVVAVTDRNDWDPMAYVSDAGTSSVKMSRGGSWGWFFFFFGCVFAPPPPPPPTPPADQQSLRANLFGPLTYLINSDDTRQRHFTLPPATWGTGFRRTLTGNGHGHHQFTRSTMHTLNNQNGGAATANLNVENATAVADGHQHYCRGGARRVYRIPAEWMRPGRIDTRRALSVLWVRISRTRPMPGANNVYNVIVQVSGRRRRGPLPSHWPSPITES